MKLNLNVLKWIGIGLATLFILAMGGTTNQGAVDKMIDDLDKH
ncbi:hypothetical protein MUDAN_BIHEEGNE_00863 [Lactiplantibacillus mudanjiangensis]|nr:hypothetical protein MUDAN_BIHEEGNE_00863 [Lactiplantibacillus mudanjiangensis]